ncbi:MAG: chemotaxis protein [Veillonellaceae bacterium]|jgi:sugar diacid utilization regulator|nr:chemotaxis protein [Veillonellaceae bacterium]
MANYKIPSALAGELVQFIKGKTGYNMIICDDTGTVIADCLGGVRVGTKHAGAQKIVQGLMDDYTVTPEEAAQNPNVKEGFSCLIEADGERIGTFGITGPIEIVRPLTQVGAAVVSARVKEDYQRIAVEQVVALVSNNVHQAAAAVEEISASSQELAATTDGVVKVSHEAVRKVKDTGKILDMSRGIATQTKLLSLNASIEAARAGVHGRGFAVVAQEMQKLAQNSADATENINKILQEIQDAIQKVIEGINQSASISAEQARAMQDIIQMVESVQVSTSELVNLYQKDSK